VKDARVISNVMRASSASPRAHRAFPSHTARKTSREKASSRSRAVAAASTSDAPGPFGDDRNLLVVGPGVLGSRIARVWLSNFPGAVVVGQTNTDAAHDGLRSVGVTPRTKDFGADDPTATRRFPYVVFSAPPSGSEDYPGEVAAALKYWDGSGAFAFTSSSAVYKNEAGEACDEESEVYEIGTNPRVDRLLKAEKVVLDAGGVVCRLAGLYHSERGAHKYFIKTSSLDSRADALVNLIHYEDAADLCFAAMTKGAKSHIYLGTDGVPITREAIARVSVESGVYGADAAAPAFTKTDGPLGRAMSNSRTKTELDWSPRYESFESFALRQGARDSYAPWNAPTRSREWTPAGARHV